MLIKQLDDFTLGYFIIRSGGVLHAGEITAFEKRFEGKRVVIILAGTFGQVMYNRLSRIGYCEVVGWYDQDYWEYRRCCMNVDSLGEVGNIPFDYALIAKTNQEDIDKAKDALVSNGIEGDKILSINCQSLNREELLSKYLAVAEQN